MSQPDPWQRAAECAEAMRMITDPDRRAALRFLQRLWVTFGNRRKFMTSKHLAEQIETIGEIISEIHADVFGPNKSKLH